MEKMGYELTLETLSISSGVGMKTKKEEWRDGRGLNSAPSSAQVFETREPGDTL